MVNSTELLKEYGKLEDHISAQEKAFKEYIAPFRERIEAIRNDLLGFLNAQNLDSVKTEYGTFYKSTIVSPRIVPDERDAYLDLCLDNWDEFGNEMLQLGAPKKEAIDNYAQTHNGALPPHVTTTSITRVNIRRS